MAEGIFASLSLGRRGRLGGGRERAEKGDNRFGPLSLWMLSKEDEEKFEEDIAKSSMR